MPAHPPAEADVETLVGFAYRLAVPVDMDADALAGFYRPGHQAAIRMITEHLAGSAYDRTLETVALWRRALATGGTPQG